jgi:uncharacterized protein DUF4160
VPTLLIVDGFRFYFFSNEGMEPPHVHVSKAEEGFSPPQVRRVRTLTEENRAMFVAKWNEYFKR